MSGLTAAMAWIALALLAASSDAEGSEYLPLQVGNSWVFEKYDPYYTPDLLLGTFSIEVVGTVSISDTTYFVVTQDWYGVIPDTVYARKEGAKVFWRLGDRDWLVYDFAATEGDSWDLLLPWYERHGGEPLRVHANFLPDCGGAIGRDTNRRYFGFEPPWFEGAWYEVYLRDVGPVFIHWYPHEGWSVGKLKEARVGGKVIPGDTVSWLPSVGFGQLKREF